MRQQQVIEEWERVFREAGLPLSESNAKRPRPRLQVAANLPIGLELRGEILEAYFDELVPLERIQAAAELLPEGLALVDAREVWHGYASAASQVRAAEYLVTVRLRGELAEDDLRGSVVRLLGRERLPGMRRRGETQRRADAGQRDLRPYIEDVEVMSVDRGGSHGRAADRPPARFHRRRPPGGRGACPRRAAARRPYRPEPAPLR